MINSIRNDRLILSLKDYNPDEHLITTSFKLKNKVANFITKLIRLITNSFKAENIAEKINDFFEDFENQEAIRTCKDFEINVILNSLNNLNIALNKTGKSGRSLESSIKILNRLVEILDQKSRPSQPSIPVASVKAALRQNPVRIDTDAYIRYSGLGRRAKRSRRKRAPSSSRNIRHIRRSNSRFTAPSSLNSSQSSASSTQTIKSQLASTNRHHNIQKNRNIAAQSKNTKRNSPDRGAFIDPFNPTKRLTLKQLIEKRA